MYEVGFQVEAIDLWIGSSALLLELALIWVASGKAFEGVVQVVSWINCLRTWAVFHWGARRRGARFAVPRNVLPNKQPYGGTVDYVDKYVAIALFIFSIAHMIFKFDAKKFSPAALVVSGVILGANWAFTTRRDILIKRYMDGQILMYRIAWGAEKALYFIHMIVVWMMKLM